MSITNSHHSALQEVVSSNDCSSHVPDNEQNRPLPLSHPPSPFEDIIFEGASVAIPGDVEKNRKEGLVVNLSPENLSPELRLWPDDIVSFDSKDDPQNPKNVSFRATTA